MSENTPLNESTMVTGIGGYGFDFQPRRRSEPTAYRGKIDKVLSGVTNLSYDELQKLVARLALDG